jgi:cysteine-S-conjugate beta-lyase
MSFDFSHSTSREKTNAEKYVLRKKLFGTDDVLPMWVADMDIDTPSFVIEALQERLRVPNFGYEEFPSSAKKAQIEWLDRHHNIRFEEEELLYSHSVVASINAAIEAFTEVGEKIIVQTPIYPPFLKSVTQHNRKLLLNPLKRDQNGEYRFDFDDLKSKIDKDTKLLLLCSPHNPVGRVWDQEELAELGRICEEYKIIVFADEIHSDLVFKPYKHTPFASLSKTLRQRCVSAYGVGKTFNLASFAISTVIISNKELREKFSKVYNKIHFAQGTSLGHIAFETSYIYGDRWLEDLKMHLQKNIALLEDICKKHNEKISFRAPQGTYLAWLDCSKMGLDARGLKDFFVNEAKLGLSPGFSFSKESSSFMRLNFGVSTQMMQEAMNRLNKALIEFTNDTN